MTRNPHPISDAILVKLKEARIARLATLDAESRPHMVPICFAFDGQVFYSIVDRKPKRVAPAKLARVRHIRQRSQVALLIDQYGEDWTKLWYILVRGQARLIPKRHKEYTEGTRQLTAKYPQYAAGMLAHDAPLIRVTPERIVSWGNL